MQWFSDKLSLKIEDEVIYWICPKEGCKGYMISTGMVWLMYPIGYHHIFNKCRYSAAIECEKYPHFKSLHIEGFEK